LTEEPIQYNPVVAERALAFAVKVDELALLLAGEPDEKVAMLLETARAGLEDELTEVGVSRFLEAILRRKAQIEWNAALPVWSQ
jgi:hypothetical protein